MILTTTPSVISEPIKALCHELVTNPEPRFLRVTPAQDAEANNCFPAVERYVRHHGGSVCYGWQIWEWPNVMIEAEFHAVWRDTKGKLHDLTPKGHPVQHILFLPDPDRRYDGRQVNNVRRPLSSRLEVRELIDACDAAFEVMNRGIRSYQHGKIPLKGEERLKFEAIQQQLARLYEQIVAGLPRPGRNDPCPCGSGKKFKKCHDR